MQHMFYKLGHFYLLLRPSLDFKISLKPLLRLRS